MKKVVLSIVFLLIIAVFSAYSQQTGQMFRMIKVSVPDSVVFTLAKDKMIEGVSVYLVSGTQSFEGVSQGSGGMSIRNGTMYLSDKTIITTKDFKTPAGFKAQKIKFNTGGKTFYYNIAKKAWE